MSDNTRCEAAGTLETRADGMTRVVCASCGFTGQWFGVGVRASRKPAASPEIVRGLVEALEAMQAAVKSLPPSAALRLSDDLVTRFLRADGRATAMLKAAKEAGL